MESSAAIQPSLFEDEENLQPVYGVDQAGLALVPFADRMVDRTKPMTVQYQTVVDGKLRRVSFVMRPGAQLELPSQHDQMVLLTLLQMSHDRAEYKELRVRRVEVFERLGWQTGGSRYHAFESCLKRLNGVALEFEVELLSRRGTPYQKRVDLSHLIDRAVVDENEEVRIEWGGMIRQAFELGDFKRLDWHLALSLPSPLTVALYRFLDRVVLSGETTYQVGWRTLATALGMSTAYDRPAKFKDKVLPHIEHLMGRGVIHDWEYQRGGKFVFHLTNYLRSQLRRVLAEQGVFPEVARQLVAGYDEMAIIRQIDALSFRSATKTGGLLVEAIREAYEMRYPDDEPEAFAALFGLLLAEEQRAMVRFAERLTGCARHGEPGAWPLDLRICIRFMMTNNLDPERCV